MEINFSIRYYSEEYKNICFKHATLLAFSGIDIKTEVEIHRLGDVNEICDICDKNRELYEKEMKKKIEEYIPEFPNKKIHHFLSEDISINLNGSSISPEENVVWLYHACCKKEYEAQIKNSVSVNDLGSVNLKVVNCGCKSVRIRKVKISYPHHTISFDCSYNLEGENNG